MRSYAAHAGVSGDDVWATIQCEDPTLDPAIQSGDYKNGVRENSWGLAQINLDAHPNITKAQATDPFFAADYITKEFSVDEQTQWTCWKWHHARDR